MIQFEIEDIEINKLQKFQSIIEIADTGSIIDLKTFLLMIDKTESQI